MLIDTHCHLDAAEFATDRAQVHAAAWDAGVRQVVLPAVSASGFAGLKAVAERYAGCVAAYGIHPLYVDSARNEDLATLRHWLAREPAVAVGEIGLDHHLPGQDKARQEFFLIEQLKLAREFDLPVLLHVRGAVDAVLKELRRFKPRGGIAHAFNGSQQQAEAFIKLGFKLGFGGTLTFSGSKRIRQLAATLPADSIVLETDAPDIPPAWLQGGRNQPAELAQIAAVFAELRGMTLAEVAALTTRNALQVLPGLAGE